MVTATINVDGWTVSAQSWQRRAGGPERWAYALREPGAYASSFVSGAHDQPEWGRY